MNPKQLLVGKNLSPRRFGFLVLFFFALNYGVFAQILSGWGSALLFLLEVALGLALGGLYRRQLALPLELILAFIFSACAVHFYFVLSSDHYAYFYAAHTDWWPQLLIAMGVFVYLPLLVVWLFKWIISNFIPNE